MEIADIWALMASAKEEQSHPSNCAWPSREPTSRSMEPSDVSNNTLGMDRLALLESQVKQLMEQSQQSKTNSWEADPYRSEEPGHQVHGNPNSPPHVRCRLQDLSPGPSTPPVPGLGHYLPSPEREPTVSRDMPSSGGQPMEPIAGAPEDLRQLMRHRWMQ